MQNTKFKAWELALMLALCITFLSGLWAQSAGERLGSKILRLHVVANSDSPADQAAKLQLRDEILALLAPVLADAATQQEALALVETQLPELEALGDLQISLKTEHFPTRDYENFSLPAGNYISLRVVMGEGQGQNWWCVLFPPLCTEALAQTGQEAFGPLTEEEKALVTQSDEGYVLKFRILELWDALCRRF